MTFVAAAASACTPSKLHSFVRSGENMASALHAIDLVYRRSSVTSSRQPNSLALIPGKSCRTARRTLILAKSGCPSRVATSASSHRASGFPAVSCDGSQILGLGAWSLSLSCSNGPGLFSATTLPAKTSKDGRNHGRWSNGQVIRGRTAIHF